MPRGRPANPDKKIADIVSQLRKALVAREQARIEATVAKSVDAVLAGFHRVGAVVHDTVDAVKAVPAAAVASLTRAKRRGWNPAAREAARKRMAAYWAAKRGNGAKAAKPVAKKGGKVSAGRAKQIAAMKAYWAAKKKAKGAPAKQEAAAKE